MTAPLFTKKNVEMLRGDATTLRGAGYLHTARRLDDLADRIEAYLATSEPAVEVKP